MFDGKTIMGKHYYLASNTARNRNGVAIIVRRKMAHSDMIYNGQSYTIED